VKIYYLLFLAQVQNEQLLYFELLMRLADLGERGRGLPGHRLAHGGQVLDGLQGRGLDVLQGLDLLLELLDLLLDGGLLVLLGTGLLLDVSLLALFY
jgi:hypothetical protein